MIKIKKISDRKCEILNNPFYIDGKGGQLGDRGKIGNANILEVNENYILLDCDLSDGEYNYTIDELRRVDIREQHTAQHMFSAIAYSIFKFNTVAFRMSEEYTTVDLDVRDIEEDVLDKLEELVNENIIKDLEVVEEIVTNEEAHKVENLRRPVKDKIKGDVRFIKIGDLDVSACAGFHVKRTSEIGIFKIISCENIKGNLSRIYFVAGNRARKDYNQKHKTIKKLTNIFSCKKDEILEMVEKSNEEKNKISSELKLISSKYAELLVEKLEKEYIEYKEKKIIVYDEDINVATMLPKTVNLDEYILVAGFDKNFTIMSNKYDCKELIKNIVLAFPNEVKGGGSLTKGNIKFNKNYKKEEIIDIIKKGIGNE